MLPLPPAPKAQASQPPQHPEALPISQTGAWTTPVAPWHPKPPFFQFTLDCQPIPYIIHITLWVTNTLSFALN